MEKMVLIKLGGSLITDKNQEKTANLELIRKFAKEIKEIQKKFGGKMIVAHGAGSFAHRPAVEYRVKEGIKGPLQLKGFPIVADLAVELNRIVIKEFLNAKIFTVSFSPESMMLSDNHKPVEVFVQPILQSLALNYLPVLYGDVVFDKTLGAGIFSTEMVLGALAEKLSTNYSVSFVYCTDTDGVYDSMGRTIKDINHKNFSEVAKHISDSGKIDVTGGMIHKVEESLKMAGKGYKTIIINGKRKGELRNAVLEGIHRGTEISN